MTSECFALSFEIQSDLTTEFCVFADVVFCETLTACIASAYIQSVIAYGVPPEGVYVRLHEYHLSVMNFA